VGIIEYFCPGFERSPLTGICAFYLPGFDYSCLSKKHPARVCFWHGTPWESIAGIQLIPQDLINQAIREGGI
jgi:hypothetical protein